MEGGVQCPGIRDSPAPTPRPPGPRDEPDQGQGSALTPHPWRLGRDGRRGWTLPLRGPSFPRARPGEEAHGKVGAGGREVRAAWAPCRRPRAARARAWTPGWPRGQCGPAPARGARAVLRLNGGCARRTREAGGRRRPWPCLLLHSGLSECLALTAPPRSEAAPTQRGPLSPAGPSAQSGHCPGGRCTLQCPRRSAFSPRSSGHPAQCDAVFHVLAAAGSGPDECPLLSAELFYLHFLNSLSR